MRQLVLAAALILSTAACTTQTDKPRTPSTAAAAPLTVAQAQQAALKLSDLPKGWELGVAPDPSPTPSNGVQYDPNECWIVRDPLRGLGKPATAVRGQYLLRADNPSDDKSITELIYSWPAPQQSLVQKLAAALPRCATVTGTWPGLGSFTIGVRQLAVRGLKDGIVLRVGDPAAPSAKAAGYSAYVVRGGTVLSLTGPSEVFPTDAAYVQFVMKAVARLDAVVG